MSPVSGERASERGAVGSLMMLVVSDVAAFVVRMMCVSASTQNSKGMVGDARSEFSVRVKKEIDDVGKCVKSDFGVNQVQWGSREWRGRLTCALYGSLLCAAKYSIETLG